jgi:hypothetical protein
MTIVVDPRTKLLRQIRWLISLFIVGLILSGVTAFPLEWELGLLTRWLDANLAAPDGSLRWWIARVNQALTETGRAHPFLAYGTDWLAFGHIIIALFFIGPWLDPIRNAWVLKIGLVACAGVIPIAMICGSVRGIPFYWRLIDCSFGVIGAVPILICLKLIARLKSLTLESRNAEK